VLGRFARIVDDVLECVFFVTNRFWGSLFGVRGVDTVDTWNMHSNGLVVVKVVRLYVKFVPPAVDINAIS
jgi:hypothetical protein